MRKIFLLPVIFIITSISSQAQVNPHAIGLRFGGGNFGNSTEVSYQHGFGEKNRFELDLGGGGGNNYKRLGISGIYHWIFNIEQGLNWYVGPGAQIWFYSYNTTKIIGNNNNGKVLVEGESNGVKLAVGGQIGMEYDFNAHEVPILISLDTRPMFNFGFNSGNFGYGINLSIRYTF